MSSAGLGGANGKVPELPHVPDVERSRRPKPSDSMLMSECWLWLPHVTLQSILIL